MHRTRRNKKCLIFDLDGVLLDSRENMSRSWETVRTSLGVDVPFEHYFNEIGRPFSEIMERIGLSEMSGDIESVYRKASVEWNHCLSFFDGVEETLGSLSRRNFALSIVTSKDSERAYSILTALSVSFSSIHCPSEGLRGKPAPDHLLVAIASANVDPAEALFVGDMDSDYEAASRAGVDFAHASWGYGEKPNGPFLNLQDISALDSLPDPSY